MSRRSRYSFLRKPTNSTSPSRFQHKGEVVHTKGQYRGPYSSFIEDRVLGLQNQSNLSIGTWSYELPVVYRKGNDIGHQLRIGGLNWVVVINCYHLFNKGRELCRRSEAKVKRYDRTKGGQSDR